MQRSKTFCVCYMSGITISHETRLVLEHCNSIIDASFFYILASHYNFTRNLTRIRIFQLHNWCFILSSDPLFMCRYTWWDHYACLALQFHTKLDSLVLEYFNSIIDASFFYILTDNCCFTLHLFKTSCIIHYACLALQFPGEFHTKLVSY